MFLKQQVISCSCFLANISCPIHEHYKHKDRMEEYDDLENGPDEHGSINLSYNEWNEMPEELYEEYKDRILKLNLSHNRLLEVSHHLGKLILLKELCVSNNCIESIDPCIGKCVRLRKLDVSHNLLREVPKEISKCVLLDTLLLHNNKLTCITDDISNLQALEQLDLRENTHLYYISPKISSIPCLKSVPCDGNDNLESMIPKGMRTNSDLVLWILRLHQAYADKIQHLKSIYYSTESTAIDLEVEKNEIQRQLLNLHNEVEKLRLDRPTFYIEWKRNFFTSINQKIQNVKEWKSRVFPIEK